MFRSRWGKTAAMVVCRDMSVSRRQLNTWDGKKRRIGVIRRKSYRIILRVTSAMMRQGSSGGPSVIQDVASPPKLAVVVWLSSLDETPQDQPPNNTHY